MAGIENKLYNARLARQRIQEDGKRYGITNISDLFLDEKDFEEANRMVKREAKIVHEKGEITKAGLFRGMVYCLLTAFQDYQTQIEIFKALMKEGFDSPSSVLRRKAGFERLMGRAVFNKAKIKCIYELAENFDSDFVDVINGASCDGIGKESQVREYLVRKVKGFGEKTASLLLRMCGFQDLVPVDTWMNTLLYFHGYPVEIDRQTAKRGDGKQPSLRKKPIRGERYRLLEDFSRDLASKYNTPAYLLQLAFWTKKSTYNN